MINFAKGRVNLLKEEREGSGVIKMEVGDE